MRLSLVSLLVFISASTICSLYAIPVPSSLDFSHFPFTRLPFELVLYISEYLDDASYGSLVASHSVYYNALPWEKWGRMNSVLNQLCIDGKERVALKWIQNNMIETARVATLHHAIRLNQQALVPVIWKSLNSPSESIIKKSLLYCVQYDRLELFEMFLSLLDGNNSHTLGTIMRETIRYGNERMMHILFESHKWPLVRRFHYAVMVNNVTWLGILFKESKELGVNEALLMDQFKVACENDYTLAVDWFLKETPLLQIKQDDQQRNSWLEDGFFFACESGSENVVKLLLDYVDPSMENNAAIAIAATSGDLPVIEVLLDDDRVNPYDVTFECALLNACETGRMSLIRFILDKRPLLDMTQSSLLEQLAMMSGSILSLILERAIISKESLLEAISMTQLNNLQENTEILMNALTARGWNTE